MTRLIRAVAYAVAFAIEATHLVETPRLRQREDGEWVPEQFDYAALASRSLRVAELAVQWWQGEKR